MSRDGEASRRRLLDAATEEFAEHGLAGARVDRIAAASGVNKAQMYGWFGSKDGLFDAVFDDQLHRIVDVVPFTAEDLPGYAVRLYDSYLTAPGLIRLASWHRLERVRSGPLLRQGTEVWTDPKHASILRAQEAGRVVADLAPEDVYALVIALAGTWSPVSGTFVATSGDPDTDHARRRAGLRQAVSRALVP
ncbi:TetR family transcriptional regulator [Pseudokineococcus sp. 1T1Z-3]|uniref:TetR family transcriptional regulator n=1 Tax=Pseudokineococcus sp. 1T1Z-3 TaxID=3132745 RepID=UPI0030992A94